MIHKKEIPESGQAIGDSKFQSNHPSSLEQQQENILSTHNTSGPPASRNAFRSIYNKPDRFHFGNLISTDSFPHDWVYEGIVERGKITLWDGREPDNGICGAVTLACCLAAGSTFRGRQSVQGRGKVIVYDALNDSKEIAGHVVKCCVNGFNHMAVAMRLMVLGPADFTPIPKKEASDKQRMANIERLIKEALVNGASVIELLNLPSSVEDPVFRGYPDDFLDRTLSNLAVAANVGIIAHFQRFDDNFAHDYHHKDR